MQYMKPALAVAFSAVALLGTVAVADDEKTAPTAAGEKKADAQQKADTDAPAAKKPAASEVKPAAETKSMPTAVEGSPTPSGTSARPIKPRKPVQPPLVVRWAEIDADKDGRASYEDITKIIRDLPKERFEYLDKDKDNFLVESELPKPGDTTGLRPPKPTQAQIDRVNPLLNLLRIADKDTDSKVTLEEYKAAYPNSPESAFQAIDQNRDGHIDKVDFPTPDTEGGFLRADANGDGRVTREEFMAKFPKSPEDRFSKIDRNGDGFFDETDKIAAAPPRVGPPPRAQRSWPDIVANLLSDHDPNKDGKMTFEEYSQGKPEVPRATFDAMDTNKDGVVSPDDPSPTGNPDLMKELQAQAPPSTNERMKRADKNGDGKLSFEEASAEFKGLTKERFDERDLNHDGFLDAHDRAARAAEAAKAPANATPAEAPKK